MTGGRRGGMGITVRVRPQVLRWLIDSAGWRDGELASKTGIGVSLIRQWRLRESEIGIDDIERLSKRIGRPLPAFMLAEPPREAPVAGFRLGPDSPAEPPSRRLCTAVRLARELQYNARELLEDAAGGRAVPSGASVSAECADDPARVAAGEAARMGLSGGAGLLAPAAPDRYSRTKLLYDALRDAVESRGVFVAQADFPVGEAKGFAVVGEGPPVIVVNSADAVGSRIFTLLHEYAHVMLAGGSLCRPAPESLETDGFGSGKAVEGWCDSFASSVLMPRKEFLAALDEEGGRAVGGMLTALSQRFLLSERTVLVRAIDLSEGPARTAYLGHYGEMGPPPEPRDSAGGGHVPPDMACLNRRGRRYARLVADSEEAGLITESDMGMYLHLKARHFDGLRAKVWGDWNATHSVRRGHQRVDTPGQAPPRRRVSKPGSPLRRVDQGQADALAPYRP